MPVSDKGIKQYQQAFRRCCHYFMCSKKTETMLSGLDGDANSPAQNESIGHVSLTSKRDLKKADWIEFDRILHP